MRPIPSDVKQQSPSCAGNGKEYRWLYILQDDRHAIRLLMDTETYPIHRILVSVHYRRHEKFFRDPSIPAIYFRCLESHTSFWKNPFIIKEKHHTVS